MKHRTDDAFGVRRPSILLILLLLVFSSLSPAQSVDWARVHTLTARGIDELYNLDPDRSLKTFDTVATIAPNDPRGHFFLSMVHFWLYALNGDQKDYDRFFELSERVIDLCNEALDLNDKDALAHFYLGGIYGYRGMAYQSNGSMLKAVYDARKGYSHLEDAIRLKPDLYDAHMGFGLFRYLVAKVPRTFSWVLNILGFDGDIEGGLNSLKLAAENGTYARVEATFFLAQFLFNEHRHDEAFAYLDRLLKKYPDNTLFLLAYAGWELRSDHPEEALAAATKAMEINTRKGIHYGEEFAYSTLGTISFNRNDFVSARNDYDLYFQKVRNRKLISNWTVYRAGLAHEMTGDRAGAVAAYGQVRDIDDKDRPYEAYNYRWAQERLRAPMSQADRLLLIAGNDMGQKRYGNALRLFKEALTKPDSGIDISIRALYGLQQLYFECDSLVRAVDISRQLLALTPTREIWIVPHAYFRLGQIYAKMGQTEDARRSFEMVNDFDDYDFQNGLERRTEQELHKLKSKSGT